MECSGLDTEGYLGGLGPLSEEALLGLEGTLEVQGAFSRRPLGLGLLSEWLGGTDLPTLMVDLLGPGARVVRAFFLNKTEEENWAVAWHQDTTLAFAEAKDLAGFGPWVNKAHFFHAQAPAEVMERLLSTRIHLDSIGLGQGPLKVLPGTHAFGKWGDADSQRLAASTPAKVLPARRGEVILMRPLLLHGSERATEPRQRRILHLEWAAFEPPGGLRWAWF